MEAITATYEEHDDDWSVTVAGLGHELTEHAPGIIAARDQAEQLVDSLKPEQGETAVVHLLHGSALEFTTAYMTARLTRTGENGADGEAGPAIPEQASGEQNADGDSESAQRHETAHEEAAEDAGAETAPSTGDAADAGNTRNTENAGNSAQELAK